MAEGSEATGTAASPATGTALEWSRVQSPRCYVHPRWRPRSPVGWPPGGGSAAAARSGLAWVSSKGPMRSPAPAASTTARGAAVAAAGHELLAAPALVLDVVLDACNCSAIFSAASSIWAVC